MNMLLLAFLAQLTITGVGVEKLGYRRHFACASGLVFHFCVSSTLRGGDLRNWFTAEEPHQSFQVLHGCCQIELLTDKPHPAQPQTP